MIGTGLFVLTILSNCVLALPVTSSHLENEDVKVMKCIVEALADVLSRPHPLPISQECLVILKMDDRLVTILRHHNFLKELQDIAVQGGQERAQLPGDIVMSDHVTRTPQTTGDVADQSMLEALGGPGERSILTQKRRTGHGDGEKRSDGRDKHSREGNGAGGKEQDNSESADSHMPDSANEWSEGEAEKREDEKQEDGGDEEKRENSEENSEEGFEENMTKDKRGDESDEKRDTAEKKKFAEEDEEENEKGLEKKRSTLFPHDDTQTEREEEEEEEDEGEMKRGHKGGLKRWTKRAKSSPAKRKAGEKEGQEELSSQQEAPRHSKEVAAEDEGGKTGATRRSPEEKELQMIARRTPEDGRASEEEGSASRKSEDPEIESLAAIESELESVAQKLHEMRRG